MSEMIKVKVRLPSEEPSFHIPSMQQSDVGRYFCRVSNSLSTKEAFADLDIIGMKSES